MCTPASVDRPWISYEVGSLRSLGRPIIPLLAGGLTADRLPSPLAAFQAVDWRDGDETSLATLRAAVDAIGRSRVRRRTLVVGALLVAMAAVGWAILPHGRHVVSVVVHVHVSVASSCTKLALGNAAKWGEIGARYGMGPEGKQSDEAHSPNVSIEDQFMGIRARPGPGADTSAWTSHFDVDLVITDLEQGSVPVLSVICNDKPGDHLGPETLDFKTAQVVFDDGTRSEEIAIGGVTFHVDVNEKQTASTRTFTLPRAILDRARAGR